MSLRALWVAGVALCACGGAPTECEQNPETARQELRSGGGWDANGTTGASEKCATMGYAPGSALHQACARMVRADYCGTGVAYTRDGTLIDAYDVAGVQRAGPEAAELFEAAWGPNGAVCVKRPRIESYSASGELQLPSCWASLPRCDDWSEAQAQGAVLGVSSRLQTRSYCD